MSGSESGGGETYEHHGLGRPPGTRSRRPWTLRQRSMTDLLGVWSAKKQESFETRIARITASAGFPLTWVDNPEWIGFCDEFVPAARLVSRKTLTTRILPSVIKTFRTEAKAATQGHEATIQADGWTGENKHHLMAFMMTADGKVRSRKFYFFYFLSISI
jgi:hypothetical protein